MTLFGHNISDIYGPTISMRLERFDEAEQLLSQLELPEDKIGPDWAVAAGD